MSRAKRRSAGIPAASWFYSQPGFHGNIDARAAEARRERQQREARERVDLECRAMALVVDADPFAIASGEHHARKLEAVACLALDGIFAKEAA